MSPSALLLLAVLAPVDASPPARAVSYDTLTVAQCAELAARNAPEVLSARAEARAAAYDSSAVAANGRPGLALAVGGLVAPEGFYDPVVTNLGEYHAKVVLDWPLADGGARRRARRSAALIAQGSRLDAATAARDATLRAIAVALDLVRADELRALHVDAESWLDDLGLLVESGVRSGRRGRADAVRVALEHDAAEAAELTTEGARGALARELAGLVGRAGDTPLAVRVPGAEVAGPPEPADSVALLARMEASPDVRRALTEAALLRVAVEDARSKRALEVGIVADAGLWGADLSHAVPPDLASSHPGATFGDRLRRDLGASIALEFRRPLTDPARGASILARGATLEAAQWRRSALIAGHRRAALDLIERGRTASAQLALAQASTERAEENVLRLRSLYAGGGVGLLELLDARRQLDDARTRLADARFEAHRAHFETEAL
ncbi:MAG: TolC family protein [Candidatus Eisenbacteria bacterium]